MSPHRRLTALQTRFVAAYLRCGRVVEAATEAGYSAATATHSAGRLLRAPHIRAALAAGRENADRCGAALHARVVRELETVAFAPLEGSAVRTADKLRALYLLGRIARQDMAHHSANQPPAAAETRTNTEPAWQEAWRRGMERVEQGRRKDAERSRQDAIKAERERVSEPEIEKPEAAPETATAHTAPEGTEPSSDTAAPPTPDTAARDSAEQAAPDAAPMDEAPTPDTPDWRERHAYFSRCYPLTHWPEDAAFYERMGRFEPT